MIEFIGIILRIISVFLMIPVFLLMVEETKVVNGLAKLRKALFFYGLAFLVMVTLSVIGLIQRYITGQPETPADIELIIVNSVKDLLSAMFWFFVYHKFYLIKKEEKHDVV